VVDIFIDKEKEFHLGREEIETGFSLSSPVQILVGKWSR
jgi:hypothetical protein